MSIGVLEPIPMDTRDGCSYISGESKVIRGFLTMGVSTQTPVLFKGPLQPVSSVTACVLFMDSKWLS